MAQNNNHDWDPPEPYYLDADDFPPEDLNDHTPPDFQLPEAIAIVFITTVVIAPLVYLVIALLAGWVK